MAKRLKAAERKASILAVAKLLFADKGFHGVSVDEIAKRLGVSPAVLYQHFPSKEALYEAALTEISEKRESYIEAVLTEPSDFATVLKRMSRIYVESVSRDPDYLRMELMSALEGSQAATRFFDHRWRALTDYIEYSLDELKNEGRLSRINPKMASLMYQGMIREVLYETCVLNDPRFHNMPLHTIVDELVQLFLNAIGYATAKE